MHGRTGGRRALTSYFGRDSLPDAVAQSSHNPLSASRRLALPPPGPVARRSLCLVEDVGSRDLPCSLRSRAPSPFVTRRWRSRLGSPASPRGRGCWCHDRLPHAARPRAVPRGHSVARAILRHDDHAGDRRHARYDPAASDGDASPLERRSRPAGRQVFPRRRHEGPPRGRPAHGDDRHHDGAGVRRLYDDKAPNTVANFIGLATRQAHLDRARTRTPGRTGRRTTGRRSTASSRAS